MRLALALTILLGGSFVTAVHGQTVDVWLTRGNQVSLFEQRPSLAFEPGAGTHSTKIALNAEVQYQEIDGFGAAMTDSSAWLIWNRMSVAQRDALMEQFFSPQSGIGLSFVRVPMGASDFALAPYTYNDQPPGQTDPTMEDFSIAHDLQYIVPLLQQARALNPELKIMASPWSPPAWMKNSGTLFGGSLLSQYYDAYALYFVKFIQAYEAQGLPIHAITVQNEPMNSSTGLPSMSMSTFQQSTFIGDHLGPALAAANLDTLIFAYDHNWDQWNYPLIVQNDPEAGFYTAGAAFHGYAGNVENQSLLHNLLPDKEIHFTEITGGEWATNFDDNLVWAFHNIIIGSTRNWSRSAIFWNLALDENNGPFIPGGCEQCRGVVTIEDATGNVTLEEEYFALAHAASFVKPGARRIESDSLEGVIETVAFENPDGSIAVIALNPDGNSRWFNLLVNGQNIAYRLTGKSVATLVWSTTVRGDMNCDGVVDLAHDLPLFIDAILNPSGYTAPTDCSLENADTNSDDRYDGQDVAGFVTSLAG